ncbi:DUF6456 domain-containing protein [Croceicoccus naphthovorans]|uniref:Uncharacterized protein n=1 Tax=Croceicoccus naphthovorans TaxID=1348774 RepID=A0A0G3XHH0_9SPHN|nr:DUF6456 domain-containing protein [Croceicoccus naphthovorans]AKM10637.1 hypothetical protein AB433_12760 [Croceicoccus naphthovorans]MBB3988867.1 hypothetical protein [Croceicoccus naphthovorans]
MSNPEGAHYVTRELTSEGPRRTSDKYAGGAPKRGRSVTVNLRESPLAWLHSRGHLSERQFDAGERLRADWERAQLSPSITMRWDVVRVKGSASDRDLTPSERQLAAKRRFHEAVDRAGPGLSDVLWRVACNGESLPDAEKALAWPARSGKLVLGLALDRVADYYRI